MWCHHLEAVKVYAAWRISDTLREVLGNTENDNSSHPPLPLGESGVSGNEFVCPKDTSAHSKPGLDGHDRGAKVMPSPEGSGWK